MSFVPNLIRNTKSIISIKPKVSSMRWFRKEDDGGISDGGGAWEDRERALEGVYIRKLDAENIARLRKKLAKKKQCEQEEEEDTEKEEKCKSDDDEQEQ